MHPRFYDWVKMLGFVALAGTENILRVKTGLWKLASFLWKHLARQARSHVETSLSDAWGEALLRRTQGTPFPPSAGGGQETWCLVADSVTANECCALRLPGGSNR